MTLASAYDFHILLLMVEVVTVAENGWLCYEIHNDIYGNHLQQNCIHNVPTPIKET